MDTPRYSAAKLAKADQLKATAEELRAKIKLLGALLDLSQTHAWEVYEKELIEYRETLLIRLLNMQDKGNLPRVDRAKAKLIAEINLLANLAGAPNHKRKEIAQLELEIEKCESQAAELEKYRFVKGASQ